MAYRTMKICCIECRKSLTEAQRTNSGGPCPKCGHRGELAVTKVECIFIASSKPDWRTRLMAVISLR